MNMCNVQINSTLHELVHHINIFASIIYAYNVDIYPPPNPKPINIC